MKNKKGKKIAIVVGGTMIPMIPFYNTHAWTEEMIALRMPERSWHEQHKGKLSKKQRRTC